MGQEGPVHLKAQEIQTLMDQLIGPIEYLDQINMRKKKQTKYTAYSLKYPAI